MAMTGEQALTLSKKYTKETAEGMGAVKGQDGFSPVITENENNTDNDYRLDITDANHTFTTPNLRGADGTGTENVQSDWNETDTTSDAYIKNKPTIPTTDGLATTEYVDNAISNIPETDLSDYYEKTETYSKTEVDNLIPTVPTKMSELENDSKYISESDLTAKDYATKTYVGEQIANVDHLSRSVVTTLPTDEEAVDNVIYMLKVESAVGNDKYQEYMKIDGTLQLIGDTSVDLTDYAKTSDVNTELDKKANVTDFETLEQTVTNHVDDTDIHVTADEKAVWNGNVDSNKVSNSVIGTNNVSVKDSAKAPIIAFKGNGYTVQDGTPTPDSPIPIQAYGELQADGTYVAPVKSVGKNLFDIDSCVYKNQAFNTSGKIENGVITVTASQTHNNAFVGYNFDDTFLKPDKTYTISCKSDSNSRICVIIYKDGTPTTLFDKATASVPKTFTMPDTDYDEIKINFYSSYGEVVKYWDIQIEEGETATDFEPYEESISLIPTSQPFYEGDYIQLNADGSGVEHRENVLVDGGNLDWQYNTTASCFAPVKLTPSISPSPSWATTINVFCPNYKTVIGAPSDKQITAGWGSLYIKDDSFGTDTAAFKTAMNGVPLVYKLKTTTDTPLTSDQLSEIRKLMSFDGETTFTTNDYDAEFGVQYYKNTDNGKVVGGVESKVEEVNNRVDEVSGDLDNIGTVTEFKWSNSTIAGSGRATEKKTLPAGSYVLILQTGYISSADKATFGIFDETHNTWLCASTQVKDSLSTMSAIATFSENTAVYGRNYSSGTMTFDDISIAGMRAIRIS